MSTLLIILLALVFISGAPLFTIMLGATALGTYFSANGFEVGFDGAINKMFGISGRDEIEVLSTIPLFIFAGYILAEAKMADRLVRFANAALGWMPGGLAVVTIFTCAVFTVFTGASGVTIIALGGVLMPALVKSGYPQKFSMGLIAGTGAVGLLFPPAVPLFIYGTVYGLTGLDKENWDTRRFLAAGVVPGLVLIGMLIAVAVFVAVRNKLPRQRFELGELGKSFLVALPELFIPIGVGAGVISGTFSPADTAALTVLYVFILEVLVYRSIKVKQLWSISYEAMVMIGAIFMIIFASTAFTDFMVNAEVPKKLVAWTQDNVESKIVFLLAINLILLIVGTVMDIFSAIVVVLPLIAPIAKAYGIDPYHLGVIFLLNLEVGYLHPPVGLNLFLTAIKFNRPITEVMWATIPFLVTMLVALLVITYVPSLTVVPEAERTAPVMNLVSLVEVGIEESKVSMPSVTLVDALGGPLVDRAGKPIVRQFKDCTAIKDETARGVCQQLFFDISKCIPAAKAVDAAQTKCANRAIASWVVKNLNGDADQADNAVITMTELPMLDAEDKPIEAELPVLDAKGEPVMTDDGEVKKEKKALVKDGKAIVKKVATCDAMSGMEKEGCRQLFSDASTCAIDPPEEVHECIDEKVAECAGGGGAPAPGGDGSAAAPAGSAPGSATGVGSTDGSAASGSAAAAGSAAAPVAGDCVKQKTEECTKTAIRSCMVEKILEWIDEYPEHAMRE